MGAARTGRLERLSAIAVLAAVVLLALLAPVAEAQADGRSTCHPQRAQRFLVRGSYIIGGMLFPRAHQRSLRYRIEQYGAVDGFGSAEWNDTPAAEAAQPTSFMGLPLSMHRRVVPALSCVEREIRKKCEKHDYRPAAVTGFRDHNTYRGGEVTNHLFGIALDIDPEKNPCCHCVEPWNQHPLCSKKVRSPYERAAMPRCYIDAFERHGFYWLGHDELEDTMHFEFLGKPEKPAR
jgi:hypothetical protein